MPNIRSRLPGDGLTATVVPGHTRTSPPRGRCRTVVSEPALIEEPAARFPADITAEPVSLTGMTASSEFSVKPVAIVGCTGAAFFPALTSSGGLSRTIRRPPAPSQEWPYGDRR